MEAQRVCGTPELEQWQRDTRRAAQNGGLLVDDPNWPLAFPQQPRVRAVDGVHRWEPIPPDPARGAHAAAEINTKQAFCGVLESHASFRPNCPWLGGMFHECDLNHDIEPVGDHAMKFAFTTHTVESADDWRWLCGAGETPSKLHFELTPPRRLRKRLLELWENADSWRAWQSRIASHLCGYGPLIRELRPFTNRSVLELHPTQALWWVESGEAILLAVQDASGRFRDLDGFRITREPAEGNWKPWALAPVETRFRFPLELTSDHDVVLSEWTDQQISMKEDERLPRRFAVGQRALEIDWQGRPVLGPGPAVPHMKVDIEPLCRRSDGADLAYLKIVGEVGVNEDYREGYLALRMRGLPLPWFAADDDSPPTVPTADELRIGVVRRETREGSPERRPATAADSRLLRLPETADMVEVVSHRAVLIEVAPRLVGRGAPIGGDVPESLRNVRMTWLPPTIVNAADRPFPVRRARRARADPGAAVFEVAESGARLRLRFPDESSGPYKATLRLETTADLRSSAKGSRWRSVTRVCEFEYVSVALSEADPQALLRELSPRLADEVMAFQVDPSALLGFRHREDAELRAERAHQARVMAAAAVRDGLVSRAERDAIAAIFGQADPGMKFDATPTPRPAPPTPSPPSPPPAPEPRTTPTPVQEASQPSTPIPRATPTSATTSTSTTTTTTITITTRDTGNTTTTRPTTTMPILPCSSAPLQLRCVLLALALVAVLGLLGWLLLRVGRSGS